MGIETSGASWRQLLERPSVHDHDSDRFSLVGETMRARVLALAVVFSWACSESADVQCGQGTYRRGDACVAREPDATAEDLPLEADADEDADATAEDLPLEADADEDIETRDSPSDVLLDGPNDSVLADPETEGAGDAIDQEEPLELPDASEEVDVQPLIDACMGTFDSAARDTLEVYVAAAECVHDCVFDPGAQTVLECTASCLVDGTTEVTEDCATCFAQRAACWADDCFDVCGEDSTSGPCFACQEETGCNEDFIACSGLAAPCGCNPTEFEAVLLEDLDGLPMGRFSCTRIEDWTVRCESEGGGDISDVPSGLYLDIAVGREGHPTRPYACGVTDDEHVTCWGDIPTYLEENLVGLSGARGIDCYNRGCCGSQRATVDCFADYTSTTPSASRTVTVASRPIWVCNRLRWHCDMLGRVGHSVIS
jgi:hypothetical protein